MSAQLGLFGSTLIAALLLAPTANALETRIGREEGARVVVGSDEIVDDNLIAAGESVVIEGTVTGNLLAFGRTVEIRGEVQGDVLTGAQRVESGGLVGGNWISFSQTLESHAAVRRSMAAFCDRFELDGEVTGDVAAFASQAILSAPVGNEVYAFGGAVEANSSIGGDLEAWTGRLSVGPNASIEGDLTARVGETDQVSIDPGASVGGETNTRVSEEQPTSSRYMQPGFYVGRFLGFLAALATGLVIYQLMPGLLAWRMTTLNEAGKAAGIGFLILVATPFAALIAAVTIIGLPLGLMTLALWVSGLYLAKVALAPAIGVKMLNGPSGDFKAFFRCFVLGLAVISILRLIPIVGGLTSFAVTLLGLGALAIQVYLARREAAPASPAA